MDLSDNLIDPDANCRLRHGLNSDCLANIFIYLDVSCLMDLAEMNDFYKNIIHDYVIHKKRAEFSEVSEYNHSTFFRFFGQRLKRFHFAGGQMEFYELLEQIINFTSEDQIISADFHFWCSDIEEYNWLLVVQAMQYFNNVEQVSICGETDEICSRFIRDVVSILLRNSNHLQKLKLEHLRWNKYIRIFDWDQMTYLTDLELVDVTVETEAVLNYIQRRPRLERFINRASIENSAMEEIGIALADYCSETIQTFADINNESVRDFKRPNRRYGYLVNLKNLKSVTLTSVYKCGNDLNFPMAALSKVDKLEKLGIYQRVRYTSHDKIPKFKLNQFTKLHTLEICVLSVDWSSDNPMHLKFLMDNSKQILDNVHTVILSGTSDFIYPSWIIQLIPNLKKLSAWKMWDLSPRSVYEDLLGILAQRKNTGNDFIEILAENSQCRSFEMYNEINRDRIKLTPMGEKSWIGFDLSQFS